MTGMAWNRINKDLLAVAYAQQNKEEDAGGGLVLFWSMTNPEFPQQTLRTKSGVTSIEFSTEHPNVLAAGLYDGSVCIYDAKKVGVGAEPWSLLGVRSPNQREGVMDGGVGGGGGGNVGMWGRQGGYGCVGVGVSSGPLGAAPIAGLPTAAGSR